jgi:hypothetical protein
MKYTINKNQVIKQLFNRTIITLMAGFLLVGCGSKDAPIPAPGATSLTYPADNTACLKATGVTGNTAPIAFSWSAASNASSYRLAITNLTTQAVSTVEAGNALTNSVSLDVNTPYSWKITAINATGETSSSVFKFYLSGNAQTNYTPFPADLTLPASGAVLNANGASTLQVTLQWVGSDTDNDIASYAVFLDNTNASTQVVASQTGSSLVQTLSSGKTYYWKVVTTDKKGNTSSSTIGSFQIQ